MKRGVSVAIMRRDQQLGARHRDGPGTAPIGDVQSARISPCSRARSGQRSFPPHAAAATAFTIAAPRSFLRGALRSSDSAFFLVRIGGRVIRTISLAQQFVQLSTDDTPGRATAPPAEGAQLERRQPGLDCLARWDHNQQSHGPLVTDFLDQHGYNRDRAAAPWDRR